jgi:hypothetical protein
LVLSKHIRCLDLKECSIITDLERILWIVLAMFSLRWDLKDLLVWPMYDLPQEKGIRQTHGTNTGSDLSLACLNDCLRVLKGLKMVLIFFLARILDM